MLASWCAGLSSLGFVGFKLCGQTLTPEGQVQHEELESTCTSRDLGADMHAAGNCWRQLRKHHLGA